MTAQTLPALVETLERLAKASMEDQDLTNPASAWRAFDDACTEENILRLCQAWREAEQASDVARAASVGDAVADRSWSITKITNDTHALYPRGRGYGVQLVGQGVTVFEKDVTVTQAMTKADARWRSEAALKATHGQEA